MQQARQRRPKRAGSGGPQRAMAGRLVGGEGGVDIVIASSGGM
jgi:hypothetical protein